MTTQPSRFYDPKVMTQAAEFFQAVKDAYEKFEADAIPTEERPLYVFGTEIIIRHRDDYTIGRIGMDDFLYFEMTDEHYGEKPNAT